MDNLVMSWHIEGSRLVCCWSKSEVSRYETAIPMDEPSAQQPGYWNTDVVFELGDAA